mmetsp:Transcript_143388/g.373669  ORF Transcript_143388/g.373669 Transcript_143388/m.373669 type:complete len:202 (+) Transcript_143388:2456-3061(+)
MRCCILSSGLGVRSSATMPLSGTATAPSCSSDNGSENCPPGSRTTSALAKYGETTHLSKCSHLEPVGSICVLKFVRWHDLNSNSSVWLQRLTTRYLDTSAVAASDEVTTKSCSKVRPVNITGMNHKNLCNIVGFKFRSSCSRPLMVTFMLRSSSWDSRSTWMPPWNCSMRGSQALFRGLRISTSKLKSMAMVSIGCGSRCL